MNTGQVKQVVRTWIAEHHANYPGLVAAHLVGSITTMPEGAPFPAYRDVDLHLIFAAESPALAHGGPFSNNVETPYHGLMLEGGLKAVAEYQSAERVLANPELAHHLMVEGSILYDPDGMLARLHPHVAREFARREWVQARMAHERRGLRTTFDLLAQTHTPSGSREVLLLGYTMTYAMALLCVATLRAPSTGSRGLLKLRDVLAEARRLDLYEATLELMGVAASRPTSVARLLAEGLAAFDLAVQVKRTPHPFGHKMHAHLRPYLEQACASLIADGLHREALFWLTPFYLAACDIIGVDGPEPERRRFAARLVGFLEAIDMGCAAVRAARLEQARQLHERFFVLAAKLVDQHPSIID